MVIESKARLYDCCEYDMFHLTSAINSSAVLAPLCEVNWRKGITQQALLGRIVLWGNLAQNVLQILPVIKIRTAPLSHQKI